MIYFIIFSVLFFIFYVVALYNRLIRLRNEVKNAYGQIHVQLVRRYDLIPNLVEIAQKYMSHERETLNSVILARQGAKEALQKGFIHELNEQNQLLNTQLGGLFALVESYPELKADRQMSHLCEELSSTENRIAFARQLYNDGVTEYNNQCQSFPSVVFALPLGFRPYDLLHFESEKLGDLRVEFK